MFGALIDSIILTWGACVMFGSITMAVATVIKNVYINLPITTIVLVGLVALAAFAGQESYLDKYLLFFNALYYKHWLAGASSMFFYQNPLWLIAIIQLVYTSIFTCMGAFIFEKRQVLE